MKIGIIGFGKMGSAIGARLVACNHELITWSRDQRKVEASKIAAYVSAPRQVTDRSDVIISILANDEATALAYCGNGRTNQTSRPRAATGKISTMALSQTATSWSNIFTTTHT